MIRPCLICILTIISLSASAQIKPKIYFSEEGKVSVAFPDSFKTEEYVDSLNGKIVTTRCDYYDEAWESGVTYQLSYAIFYEDLSKADPKTLLNSAIHDLATNMRGEIWDKKCFNFENKPGLSGTILSNSNALIAQVQVVQSGQIQYTMLVVYPLEDELTTDAYNAINFFNSFKLY